MGAAGFEPATSGSGAPRSILLSYAPSLSKLIIPEGLLKFKKLQ